MKVESIGTKYLRLSGGILVDKNTLKRESNPYGQAFLGKPEYLEELNRQNLFNILSRKIGFSLNDGVTSSDIIKAAKLLKISIEEKA